MAFLLSPFCILPIRHAMAFPTKMENPEFEIPEIASPQGACGSSLIHLVSQVEAIESLLDKFPQRPNFPPKDFASIIEKIALFNLSLRNARTFGIDSYDRKKPILEELANIKSRIIQLRKNNWALRKDLKQSVNLINQIKRKSTKKEL
jgi:hypothetical protein